MSTILLELSGVLQSWGSASKFNDRLSELYPTKSGVIGLIANALGRDRKDDISDLASLKFGIRIDQPGELIEDFHTARGAKSKDAHVTRRYYLSDAKFLVGLESDNEELLAKIAEALQRPKRPLFLGRRSCPPLRPPFELISQKSLEEALRTEKLPEQKEEEQRLNIWVDSNAEQRNRKLKDYPLSFNPNVRRHRDRYIRRLEPVIIPGSEIDFFGGI